MRHGGAFRVITKGSKEMREFFSTGVLIAIVVLILCISPLLTLWALNTISEQSGFGWYIPHNVWTYLSVWGLVFVFNGGGSFK